MAKKVNKSLAEELKTSAIIWSGVTNKDNTRVFIVNFNSNHHVVLIEETETNIVYYAPKETLALKAEIGKALYEVHPELKKKDVGAIPTTSFTGIEVVGDDNELCFSKSIKVLSELTVRNALDKVGIDTTKYTYTKINVDNSHNLKEAWATHGYKNYSQEVLDLMTDVSKYKTYTMDKIDEYEMMDAGCYLGMVAAGPAGTGKSTDPLIYCAKEEIPVIVFQCTQGTEDDAIIGNFIPNTDGTGYKLKRGPLANAIEQDCWLVINEANYCPSGILSCLNSIMDDNGQVLLDDGTMLHRGPNFRLILTVNPGYRGTNLFNEATLNRFATVYYPPITKDTLIKRLSFESGYKNKKVLAAVAEQFDKLRNIYESRNMETEVTYRNAIRFLKMRLLKPEVDIVKQFDMAFITNAIFEMNDITTELNDLQEIRKDMVSEIEQALADGTEEAKETSWSCDVGIDLDDLTSQIGEDGSFLDDEEE